jgi:TPR repeat protein
MRNTPICLIAVILALSLGAQGVEAQDAPYDRAIVAQYNGDYDAAEALFIEGAQTSAYGKYWLARFYEDVRKDYVQAAHWYELAAQEGDNGARISLASMYEKGLGVTQDYHKAHSWYTQAAENDSMWSVYKLGVLYEQGLGVRKNPGKARRMYKKAASHGFLEAKERLEDMQH